MGQVCTIGSRSKPVLNRVVVWVSFPACCGLGYEKDHQTWKHSIRWKFNNFLEDLDFANDLALISSSLSHIQTKVSNLGCYAKMTGLKINTAKTTMMCWNNTAGRKVQVNGKEPEMVSKFVNLGGRVTREGDSDEDIKSRLGKARAAFSKLRNIWKSSQLKLETKLKIFKSNVIASLSYSCETWRMTKRDGTKLDVFLHKSLRRQKDPGRWKRTGNGVDICLSMRKSDPGKGFG